MPDRTPTQPIPDTADLLDPRRRRIWRLLMWLWIGLGGGFVALVLIRIWLDIEDLWFGLAAGTLFVGAATSMILIIGMQVGLSRRHGVRPAQQGIRPGRLVRWEPGDSAPDGTPTWVPVVEGRRGTDIVTFRGPPVRATAEEIARVRRTFASTTFEMWSGPDSAVWADLRVLAEDGEGIRGYEITPPDWVQVILAVRASYPRHSVD